MPDLEDDTDIAEVKNAEMPKPGTPNKRLNNSRDFHPVVIDLCEES